MLVANPPIVAALLISQVPPPITNPILALVIAIMGEGLSSFKAPLSSKQKRKETTVGPSKKSKKKVGGMSSTFLPSSGMDGEVWKLEFFTVELSRQVAVVNTTKDCDTSLAFAFELLLSILMQTSWD
ncbi:hypothetical protein Acr_00g0037440 [Actinidia rufa]|uniref:Uncharacterized protein n=1 Tax=Actinidia rufa TaxID=165716 RepID=A0A7J0DGU7_9ERIC|nr:hypothetical protein Acr_00g0037440 [Actinidia rufa]